MAEEVPIDVAAADTDRDLAAVDPRRGCDAGSFVAGVWLATPLQYVAALAAILASGTPAGTQVTAVVAYHVVALAFAEIPLLTYLVAPDRTQAVMLRVHDWVQPRRRQLIAAIISVAAILLVINGIGSL